MTHGGDQRPPADRDGPAADLAGNPGVIATTLLSGVIAVAVAAVDGPGPPPARAQVPELPTGTVTFLFTDIEGSTRLLQELGGRYPAVRDEHAAILRRAIRDRDGVEVSTEGDSFFAAFASPVAAVGAAVAAQRAWPPTPGRRGSRCGCGWACTPAMGCWVATTTSASTSTGRPGSPGRPTAAR
jgi:class 3 adenylate cyclase